MSHRLAHSLYFFTFIPAAGNSAAGTLIFIIYLFFRRNLPMRNIIFAFISVLMLLYINVPACLAGDNVRYPYAIFLIDGLGEFGDNTRAVNNHGIVTGISYPGGPTGYHAFISDGVRSLDLGTMDQYESWGWDINDSNQVTGTTKSEDRAFFWDPVDGMQDIGSLYEGLPAYGKGINNHGQVVGVSDIPGDDTYEAFLWDDGVMIGLGSLGDTTRSRAYAINSHGVAVGESLNNEKSQRPVMWIDNTIIDLGSLGDGMSRGSASDINDHNEVVGQAYDGCCDFYPYLWKDGTMYQLAEGNDNGWAGGINNASQVVGAVNAIGFVWDQEHGLKYLNKLMPPRNVWFIEGAREISDTGYISAEGRSNQNEWFSTFLLVPVDPELKITNPIPGIAGQTNVWQVTGATPGANIRLAYAIRGGGTVIPGCDKLDAVLQLENPRIIQTVIADAEGIARFEIDVVERAADFAEGILFQAIDANNCEESQLKLFVFE